MMTYSYRDIDFEHAVEIAMQGHYGQTDKAGEPYILHIFRVIDGVRRQGFVDSDYLSAAALHDLLEDTDWTLDRLRAAGINNDVIAAVWALTWHKDAETYSDYIERVHKNEITRIVKIADIKDHLTKWPNAEKFPKYKVYQVALSVLHGGKNGAWHTSELMDDLRRVEAGGIKI